MRVAVIGGGIQGSCVAMELADRGVEVDLIESRSRLMDGASRHTEGKIHLGFVYANDPTLKTADLMIRGAFSFAPLMRNWLGTAFEDVPLSSAFDYVVHPDSLLPADDLESVYKELAVRIRRAQADGEYFDIEAPYQIGRLDRDEIRPRYGDVVKDVFATQEIAVDPEPVANLVAKTVSDDSGIVVKLGTAVTAVDSVARSLHVTGLDGTERTLGPYDHIVNCSWQGRPAIDATLGLIQNQPWSFRMKYFARLTKRRVDDRMPTATIVLGAFGDVVDYGTGDCYVCWYPVGRRGWSFALKPPEWPTRPDLAVAEKIVRESLARLSKIIPKVNTFEVASADELDVRGGVIYALGTKDVDDARSKFHQRSQVGVTSSGGWYHSVDTGKYTTAPVFAVEAANRITQR